MESLTEESGLLYAISWTIYQCETTVLFLHTSQMGRDSKVLNHSSPVHAGQEYLHSCNGYSSPDMLF